MKATPNGGEAGGNFRLVSFNIRRCHGLFRVYSPHRVLAALMALAPDAVALQEVDSGLSCAGADQLAWLARQLGMDPVPGYCRPARSGGRYGNALLLRRSPLVIRCHDLSTPGREPRGALEALIEAGNARLTIIVTHLGLKQSERREQIGKLAEIVAAVAGPLVIAGDFNEWRPGPALAGAFEGKDPETPATWPSLLPLVALDRIRTRPAALLQSLFAPRSAAARLASDHLPLVADLQLEKNI